MSLTAIIVMYIIYKLIIWSEKSSYPIPLYPHIEKKLRQKKINSTQITPFHWDQTRLSAEMRIEKFEWMREHEEMRPKKFD